MRRWFESNSLLHSELVRNLSAFPFSIEAFNWPGSNSILARKKASIDLAQVLDARIESGVTNLIVIGHSHGGNVIVDAVALIKHDFFPS